MTTSFAISALAGVAATRPTPEVGHLSVPWQDICFDVIFAEVCDGRPGRLNEPGPPLLRGPIVLARFSFGSSGDAVGRSSMSVASFSLISSIDVSLVEG